MKYQTLITELEALAAQLGLKVRYEKGDFEGGYCIVKDDRMLVVNKKLPDQRKAAVLANALNEFGLDNMFIKPTLREYIEDEAAKARARRPESTAASTSG
jgi:hypothetical protein